MSLALWITYRSQALAAKRLAASSPTLDIFSRLYEDGLRATARRVRPCTQLLFSSLCGCETNSCPSIDAKQFFFECIILWEAKARKVRKNTLERGCKWAAQSFSCLHGWAYMFCLVCIPLCPRGQLVRVFRRWELQIRACLIHELEVEPTWLDCTSFPKTRYSIMGVLDSRTRREIEKSRNRVSSWKYGVTFLSVCSGFEVLHL